jgi:2-succinyl-6-hydroxy-2,4-cyclohexadiene-1-carboxylate synthase
MAETLALLHGFGGSCHSWERVIARLDGERYRPHAIDLRGHGSARDRRPITLDACAQDVAQAVEGEFVLCGYSMGGRVALTVALAHPHRVTRLVLVSTTAGLASDRDRRERVDADESLARELESATPTAFAARWRSQPLFASDPPWLDELARADLGASHPPALAAALRGMGTGAMTPVWDRLGELQMPVTVVVGERDTRYVQLGELLVAALPRGELAVLGGGHALHLETPEALASLLGHT